MPSHTDPAERAGYLRLFYRDWRPTVLGRVWSRAFAWLTALGLTDRRLVTLLVQDRHGAGKVAHVLVPVTVDGATYLVSMLGEASNWVQDTRAAHGAAILRRGRSRPVILSELPIPDRPPILKAWCQIATSGRQHLPISPDAPMDAFIPLAPDYPVFRVDRAG